MFEKITESDFRASFHRMGRGEQFTYNGLTALYNYLVQYEEDCDADIEMDVIGLCCDFAEYDTLQEALNEYNLETEQELQDSTTVIPVEGGGVIVQAF